LVLFVCLGVWRLVRGVCIVHVGSFAQAGLRFDWVILFAARSAGTLCYRNRVFLSLHLAGSWYPQGDISIANILAGVVMLAVLFGPGLLLGAIWLKVTPHGL
jgi:hypothetical protein